MNQQYTCPQGHQWEEYAENWIMTAPPTVCPVCGGGGVRRVEAKVVETHKTARIEPEDTTAPAPPEIPATVLEPSSVEENRTISVSAPKTATPEGTVPLLPDQEAGAAPSSTADDFATLARPPLSPLPEGHTFAWPESLGDEPPLPKFIGGYEILDELGRGGMGVVYRARQIKLNRLVALKMILAGPYAGKNQLKRFQREAEAVAQLHHSHIVQIHEIGEFNGQPFFSLELMEGGSLADKLNGTPMPPRPAAELVALLARAVAVAHQQGIMHRDLKPANVLLTPDGQPKIGDFGLAKRLDEEATLSPTANGYILGTPSYMAPELAGRGAEEVGPSVDIYALGAILYESLTGRPPFKGATALDTLREVLHDDVVPPRQFQRRVPRDLETICLKALAKTPARRYASALEMAEDLERFLKGEPIKARPMGRAERLWHWCRHNPVAASLLVAVTLGSAFGLWHLSRLSKQLVESTALESAAQEASMLEEVNNVYSADVAERVKPLGVLITNDYLDHPGAIPVPATLTIVLGRHMSTKDQEGMQVRLYSDYPFYSRKDGGPQDEFEKEALAALRRNSAEPYYRFVDFQGRPAVRYAQARVMQQACVNCHNTHPESPKKDWKVGDVRGVLEIIRPLEADAARTRAGLWSSFLWMGVLSAGLLALCGLILFLGRRRRARSQSARAPSP